MNEKRLHTPEGVRDIYGIEYKRKMNVESKLHHVLELYGYQDIQTPTFEFFDIFNRDKGSALSNEMFKLFDRNNNTLVLRPDMTPSIARCVAKYYEDEDMPIRLSYSGSTFANMTSYQGKLNETTQMGAEYFGEDSSVSDAEIVAAVVNGFLEVGLKDFQIEIGHIDFFKGLIEESSIDEETEVMYKEFINTKNFFGLEQHISNSNLDEAHKQAFMEFDNLYGGKEIFEKAKKLTSNKKSLKAIERLEKLNKALSFYGFDKYISYDLGMLSRYDYYTGIIFKGYTYGTGDAVVRGGRYNNLVKQFGKDIPAIGFAFFVDELMLALSRQKIEVPVEISNTLLVYNPGAQEIAVETACKMRNLGKQIELIRKSSKKDVVEYIQYAKRCNIKNVIYIVNKDLVENIDVSSNNREHVNINELTKGL